MTGPEIGTLKGSSVTLGRFSSGVVVRARRNWTDAEGRTCPADYLGRIQQLTRERFDPLCPIDVLLEDQQGKPMHLRYALTRGGPQFEDLFEALSTPWGPWPGQEEAPLPAPPLFRSAPPPAAEASARAPIVDVRAEKIPSQPSQDKSGKGGSFEQHLARALELLGSGQPSQANEYWMEYVSQMGPMGDWGEAARLARQCSDWAMAQRRGAIIADPVAWNWLREQSMRFWYSWAGQATSGGEGTAMMLEVDAAERRFNDAEREHLRWGGPALPER